jgi:hypothetical protein
MSHPLRLLRIYCEATSIDKMMKMVDGGARLATRQDKDRI